MKKLLTLSVLFILLLSFSACKKDSSPVPVPTNEKFKGKWNVSETYTPSGGTAKNFNYQIEITAPSVNTSEITFDNFGDLDDIAGQDLIVDGIANGNNFSVEDTFSQQSAGTIKTYTLIATGTISNNNRTLTFTYQIKNTISNDLVGSATCVAQKVL